MKILISLACFFVSLTYASSLQDEVQQLNLNQNAPPKGVSMEKLYVAQARYVPLSQHIAFSVGGGKNFNTNSFLASQELNSTLRYYLNDRFFLAAYGSYVFNSLSSAGERLWSHEEIFPDVAYTRFRADAMLGTNLFYGKFRLSMDQVFYFDHYLAIGGGIVGTTNGLSEKTEGAYAAETGLGLWFGKRWSTTLGLKGYYFKETRRLSEGPVLHLLGLISIGYLFGGMGDV